MDCARAGLRWAKSRHGKPIWPGAVRVARRDHHVPIERGKVRVSRGPTQEFLETAAPFGALAYGPAVIGGNDLCLILERRP